MADDAQKKARADKARRILEDQMFKDAVEATRRQIMTDWELSKPNDERAREYAWVAIVTLKRIVNNLRSHMLSGELAEKAVQTKRHWGIK